MLLRRLLILVFALLQCMAPLLHAHAGAAQSGGVHVHADPAGAAEMTGEAIAVTPAVTLEVRAAPAVSRHPLLIYRLPAHEEPARAAWMSLAATPCSAPYLRHLTSPPAAPPHV